MTSRKLKKYFVIMATLVCAFAFASCAKTQSSLADDPTMPAQLRTPQLGDTIAEIETSRGVIKMVLYEEQAPLACQNFIALAEKGYYNGVTFHRVVKDFVAQTGDPTGTGRGGESSFGDPFANEYSQKLHHYVGAVGMANPEADENTSQFYFVTGASVSTETIEKMRELGYSDEVLAGYQTYGGQPGLDFKYTVFGQVYEGLDVLGEINGVKTDGSDRPKKDITINSVTISVYAGTEEADDAAANA